MKSNDAVKAVEGSTKTYYETELAVQEWGIKEGLRLFGIKIADFIDPVINGDKKSRPQAKAYFADASFKNMITMGFDIKSTGGKVTVLRSKRKAIKWPIKFARTK